MATNPTVRPARPYFKANSARRRLPDAQPLWLWALVLLVAVGPLALLLTNEGGIPGRVRGLGGLLWFLALLPTIVFFATPAARRPPIPLMPIMGVLFGLYFSLQLLFGTPNPDTLVTLDAAVDYDRAIDMALMGWVSLLIGLVVASLFLPARTGERRQLWRPVPLKRWAFAMQLGGFILDVARSELPVPVAVRGLLAFGAMIALFGTAVLIVLAQRGHLSNTEKTRLWAITAAIALVQIGTGSVANFTRVGIVVLIAGWIAGARLRAGIVTVGLVLALATITLRGFAIDFRQQAWTGEDFSQAERTGLWYSLVTDHAQEHGLGATVSHGVMVVATRTAYLDIYADVIRQTPRSVPYWEGRTYLSLVGAFVPRILWPDKPQKNLGQEFGHRYGYLHPNDRSTSINLPFLVEFYANFGENGVLIGMFLVGCILAVLNRLLNRPGQDWVRTLCGLVLLVPIVTNIESDFSLVFGGLILNGFAIYLVYRFLVRRCGQPLTRPAPVPVRARNPTTARP